MILSNEDTYLKRFRHYPWDFLINCDDIDFGNKFKEKAMQRNGFLKPTRRKSCDKAHYKYQNLNSKNHKENKSEIKTKHEMRIIILFIIYLGEHIEHNEPQLKSFKEFSRYIKKNINNDFKIKEMFNINQNKKDVLM